LRRHGSGADGSLNGAANARSWGKGKLMSGPGGGRHHRCADLPEAVGVCGEPADASREVANGRGGFASAPLRCSVIRGVKTSAQTFRQTSIPGVKRHMDAGAISGDSVS